jgi:hypothetical protein
MESHMLFCRLVASLLNWLIPTWPLVGTSSNTMFPLLQQDWEANYCTYSYPLRVRIAVECMAACDDLCAKMHQLQLPLLAVHSIKDTMTDPEGSKQLHKCAQVGEAKLDKGLSMVWTFGSCWVVSMDMALLDIRLCLLQICTQCW